MGKNTNAIKWIKPEEFENLKKMAVLFSANILKDASANKKFNLQIITTTRIYAIFR